MSNFFRKDLNLGRKWWHRLLAVIFFWLFVYCIFSATKSMIFEWGLRPVHRVQSKLEERITTEVKSAKELLKQWEVLYRGSPYGVNIFLFRFYWEGKYQGLVKEIYNNQDDTVNGLFCSNQLYAQINEVIKKTGISKFYVKEINNFLEPVSTKIATEYIKNNNVKCILIDGFWGENKFLNPWWVAQEYQNDYYFYKKTGFANFLTIMEVITWIITVIVLLAIPFSLLMLIYYKIILYVIYGKSKKKK